MNTPTDLLRATATLGTHSTVYVRDDSLAGETECDECGGDWAPWRTPGEDGDSDDDRLCDADLWLTLGGWTVSVVAL